MATIDKVQIGRYTNQRECVKDLLDQGCKDLGWVNDHTFIRPREFNGERAFFSKRGFEIIVDPIRRMFYSVDMGD